MTLETESGAIIKKIEEQCNDIIKKIPHRHRSENLKQIEKWIKQQINNKFSTDNIQLLAIIIDTIYQCFKKEFDKEKTNLIENCLTNIIDKCSNLSTEKTHEIACHLKVYNKTDDADAQTALKEFVDIPGLSTNFIFLGDLSKKLVSSCGKSLSKFSNTIKTEFNSLSAVELATEAGGSNPFPFFKDTSSEKYINNPTKYKKKVKVRIIAFDEDGIGYDVNSPYLYSKEINRLNEIDLEIDSPTKIKKKLLLEATLDEELERLTRIEINVEPDINKIERKIKIKEFDLFANQDEKDARLAKIKQKRENNKKYRERQKMSKLLIPKILPILKIIDIYKQKSDFQPLSIECPTFEATKDEFLAAFLKTFDYEKFKELIIFTEYILITIDKIKLTLKKIDDFSEGLGVASNYMGFLDSFYIRIKENFNRQRISDFLQNALILFEQRTLALDNNYCLVDQLNEKNEIAFSYPVFLDKFISANNNTQIYKILSAEIKQFFSKKNEHLFFIKNKNFKSKKNLINRFVSFFYEEYYFTSKKFKKKCINNIFLSFSEPSSVEAMKSILDSLSWWQFFLMHMGTIFVLKKGFRKRLSEELFLFLLEEKFKKIDEKQESNAKNIDELYEIKNHIKCSKSKISNHSIDLQSLNLLDSRQEIVYKLKNHKKIKHLLDNVKILSNQALNCIDEFNNLQNSCRRECEKITENVETFQINKKDVSKLYFSMKSMR